MAQEFNKSCLPEYMSRFGTELTNMIKRNMSCCISGHRPQKLGLRSEDVRKLLLQAIESAVSDGYWYFITGGSIGVDSVAADIILELRDHNPEIFLEIAVPCPSQPDLWSKADREKYRNTLSRADFVNIIETGAYHPGVMQKRNKYMIDKCSLLICAYNGSPGGTRNTVRHAESCGIGIVNVLPGNWNV